MNITREEGQIWLGLDRKKATVLIIGGSLGARSINETIDQQLVEIISEDVQLIWQTGKPYYEQARQKAAAYSDKVKVFEFIREMDYAYAAADIVISRAGALAIAELCIAAKPVVFVPYPFAAEDHQTSNAMALVERNAAMMVKDNDVKTELLKKLKTLLHDKAMQEIMTNNLKAMAIKDADDRIAKRIIDIVKEKN